MYTQMDFLPITIIFALNLIYFKNFLIVRMFREKKFWLKLQMLLVGTN